MKKDNYTINKEVLKNYVDAINSINISMSQIKEELIKHQSDLENVTKGLTKDMVPSLEEQIVSISIMSEAVKDLVEKYSNSVSVVYTDIMKQIMDTNNGMLSTRMIEPLNISRQYLSIMEDKNYIEKVSRGIYVSPDSYEDSYYSFQQKYKKAIFSHMNALYFYGMTEEFPSNYTVTVPQRYHVDTVNEKCDVFYASDDIYELGIVEVKTPSGNKVRAYDMERCICDIIRSKGRMNPEQVKKVIKQYVKRKDKDISKLSKYADKMGISKKVMDTIGVYYD